MVEINETRYCEVCKKKTLHIVREDALEIEYQCKECHQQQAVYKNFF